MFVQGLKTSFRRLILFSLFSLLLIPPAFARNDSIYGGTQIKLDIASPIIMPAANKWQIQHYELAANVRLANRFYPTLELGYSGGNTSRGDSIAYNGHGGFMRIGCDIHPLKKHPESPHALLIGVRLGTSVQGYSHHLTPAKSSAEASTLTSDPRGVRADCWGEIVAGCQVEICKVEGRNSKTTGKDGGALYMGWMGRLKCLFTRQSDMALINEIHPIYIPGFGDRDNIGWGVNYYIGWRF